MFKVIIYFYVFIQDYEHGNALNLIHLTNSNIKILKNMCIFCNIEKADCSRFRCYVKHFLMKS